MKLSCLRAAASVSSLLALLLVVAPSSPAQQSQNPRSAKSAPSAGPVVDRHMSRGEYIAREALSYRGAPYRFGGTSRRGIDCSALVQAAYRQWGLMLPRTSVEQFRRGVAVHQNELRAGDVLFFKNTYKRGISHVGIYVGEGKFVHAAGRRQGVIVSSLASAHYQKHLAGARRLALDKEPVHAQPQQSDLPPAPEDEAPEPQR